MQVVYRRCCGIDVHKDSVTATILVFPPQGEREVRTQQFGTYWKELQRLAQWLRSSKVEKVAMESTGVYWKPVWNILDTVLSDLMGASGQAMVRGIIAGRTDPGWLADYAKGTLRGKREELQLVLRGDIRDHHRYLLAELMADLDFIKHKLLRVEAEIARRMQSYADQIARLCSIPGMDELTAWTLIAELGADMTVFPTAAHAASWAGLCPGNRESAGKRLGNRTKKGNRWLRRALCQCAWGVTRKKDCYLQAHYLRRVAKSGVKKAIIATAHQLLIIAYHLLRDGGLYRELGGGYYDSLHPVRTQNRLIRRLERLGLQVDLRPAHPATPLPADATTQKRPRGRPCKCLDRQFIANTHSYKFPFSKEWRRAGPEWGMETAH
jgi:transposase